MQKITYYCDLCTIEIKNCNPDPSHGLMIYLRNFKIGHLCHACMSRISDNIMQSIELCKLKVIDTHSNNK